MNARTWLGIAVLQGSPLSNLMNMCSFDAIVQMTTTPAETWESTRRAFPFGGAIVPRFSFESVSFFSQSISAMSALRQDFAKSAAEQALQSLKDRLEEAETQFITGQNIFAPKAVILTYSY